MNFKHLSIILLAAAAIVSCDNNRVQVSDTGLKFQSHDRGGSDRKPKVGDILTFHLMIKNSRDSVLRDTHKEGAPVQQMLQVPAFKGSFEEGLAMMAKGDSMSFFVNADSLFARMGQPAPPYIAKGSDLKFTVKMIEVQNEKEFQQARTENAKKQVGVDAKTIDAYVAKNKLAAMKTNSGISYVITQPSAGPKPVAGDIVVVHYVGKTLDGKEFDSSYKNPQSQGKPVEFQIGVGGVIPGWDEAVLNMNKGSKQTIILPSSLAYGEASPSPAIPANSVLVFDIELVDIKKKK